jgi:hypothetical protein
MGFVYFFEQTGPTAGSIRVYDETTRATAALAAPLLSPVAAATDAENVYWVDMVCGSVMAVAR